MAVQAARLGADVHFVGSIGNDDFGRAFTDLMLEEGVNIDLLKSRESLATGAGFIIKSADGYNIITIDIGANQLFKPGDIDEAAPTDRQRFCRFHPTWKSRLIRPFMRQKSDMRRALPLFSIRRRPMICGKMDLSAVDILTPNETELRVCFGMLPGDAADEVQLAKALLERGCRTVLVTLGERGSVIVTADGVTEVPAFNIAGIVDSNGAGDSFNASLATGLARWATNVVDAARFGNAVAGLCCTRWDTVPSYHTVLK